MLVAEWAAVSAQYTKGTVVKRHMPLKEFIGNGFATTGTLAMILPHPALRKQMVSQQ